MSVQQLTLQLERYLERIGYNGPLDPTVETLKAIHTAHTLSIPYENIDIILGRPILIDHKSVFDKLVTKGRGGYCFEMNTLFAWVLQELGFQFDRLFGRVWLYLPPPFPVPDKVPPASHMLMRVKFENDEHWIADAGFGGPGPIEPVSLEPNKLQRQPHATYRIIEDPNFQYLLQRETSDGWSNLYTFTTVPCFADDYIPANYYSSHSPDSQFTQMRACSILTLQGSVTLTNKTLKQVIDHQVVEREITTSEDYIDILKSIFNIHLDNTEIKQYVHPLFSA